MKRCGGVFDIATAAGGTIVLEPVAIKSVTVAYLVTLQHMAGLDGGRFTGVLDEAITFGSA